MSYKNKTFYVKIRPGEVVCLFLLFGMCKAYFQQTGNQTREGDRLGRERIMKDNTVHTF